MRLAGRRSGARGIHVRVTPVGHPLSVDVIGRCEAPGCERSTRVRVELRGGGPERTGLACPRHATQTELGALLRGWTVVRRA